jgi:hypothetical protein
MHGMHAGLDAMNGILLLKKMLCSDFNADRLRGGVSGVWPKITAARA